MNKKMILNGQEISVVSGAGDKDSGNAIPAGVIVMWSGADVPDGWAICDGTNGTPDLRGRFVLGQSNAHAMGSTGGSEEVTLTEAQMPMHRHDIQYLNTVGTSGSYGPIGQHSSDKTMTNTSATGGSQPHPNMPPYYTLAYIIKL